MAQPAMNAFARLPAPFPGLESVAPRVSAIADDESAYSHPSLPDWVHTMKGEPAPSAKKPADLTASLLEKADRQLQVTGAMLEVATSTKSHAQQFPMTSQFPQTFPGAYPGAWGSLPRFSPAHLYTGFGVGSNSNNYYPSGGPIFYPPAPRVLPPVPGEVMTRSNPLTSFSTQQNGFPSASAAPATPSQYNSPGFGSGAFMPNGANPGFGSQAFSSPSASMDPGRFMRRGVDERQNMFRVPRADFGHPDPFGIGNYASAQTRAGNAGKTATAPFAGGYPSMGKAYTGYDRPYGTDPMVGPFSYYSPPPAVQA